MGKAAERARVFEEDAPRLAIDAAEAALAGSACKPEEIDAVIFTSCSCPVIPALDTHVIEALGFRSDVTRLPSYQFGCAGGVLGLGLAQKFGPAIENVMLVSCEICSLVFHADDRSPSSLIGAAIFGDGAAATVISREYSERARVRLIDHQSMLIPNTREVMGYDIKDDGSYLRLQKELPSYIATFGPKLIASFLSKHGIQRSDISWWLFHPGGSKILDYLNELLGLEREQSSWSDVVLRDYGNLSSATVLVVLQKFIESARAKVGDKFIILGVGPGLTLEVVLAECCS